MFPLWQVAENISTHHNIKGCWKFPGGGGGGVSKDKICNRKYEKKLEFPEELEIETNRSSVGRGGGMNIFWSVEKPMSHSESLPFRGPG